MSEEQVLAVLHPDEPRCKPYVAWPPLMAWIREHGANPDHVRKLELILLDAPLVRFHRYKVDENGMYEIDGDSIAMLPPLDVLMRRPIPDHPDSPLKELPCSTSRP